LQGSSLFSGGRNNNGVKKLRRVLFAFAIRNERVGYCQAMNFVAAVFLIHMSEEAAFWALTCVVEDLVPDYYLTSMIGVRRDSQVFAGYIEKKLPKLHEHFQKLNVMYEPLVMNWFLQLFVNTLPFHTTLRVWDVFLHEGVKVLFRVGVTILKVLENILLGTTDFGALYTILTEGIDLSECRNVKGNKDSSKKVGSSSKKDNSNSLSRVTGGGDGSGTNDCRIEGDALIAMAFRLKDIGSMSTKKLVELRRKVVENDESLQ
jgi:hypothetical protein